MLGSPPFFIVGSGRSGTTLLRLLLCNHSRIHIPPETWFIAPLAAELPLDAALTAPEIERAIEIMTGHYRWPDMEISAADLRRWSAKLQAPRLCNIIDLVYEHFLERSGKRRIGDKTPPYIMIVPQLARLYPGAKFIHLIRDGRDVSISQIELGWNVRFYQGRRCSWIRAMQSARNWRQSQFAADFLEIKYEELVDRPESTLRHICDFLGEDFEPKMLAQPRRIGEVPVRERLIHPLLGRPLSRDALAIWRHRLSPVETFWMEACLYPYLEELGYGLRFRHRGWRPFLAATGLVLRLIAPLLDRAIPYLKRRNLMPQEIYI